MIRSAAVGRCVGLVFSLTVNLAVALGLAAHRPSVTVHQPTPPPLPPPVVVPAPVTPPPESRPRAALSAAAASTASAAPNLPALELPPVEFSDPATPALRLAELSLGQPLLPNLALIAVGGESDGVIAAGPGRASARLLGQLQIERFYPRRARQQRLGGRSVIDLEIDAGGKVVAQQLVVSDPPGLFDEAALRLAASLRFEPAQADNRAVASRLRQTILWSPVP